MKKNVVCSFVLFLVVALSAGSAFGYALNFDADAGGTNTIVETTYGWDLEGQNEEVVNGVARNIVTHQFFGGDGILNNGDIFTENFTLNVSNGTGPNGDAMEANVETGGTGYYNGIPIGGRLYLDVSLGGAISGYSNGGDGNTTFANFSTKLANDSFNTNFTSGSATLYVDIDGDKDFTAADGSSVATFTLTGAGPFIVVPSVFTGAAGTISFVFEFDSINAAYFSQAPGFPDPNSLIGQNWLLAVAQGGLALGTNGIGGAAPPEQILLGWRETGLDSSFSTVPEPTTIFLLGMGLVGISGIARKRGRK